MTPATVNAYFNPPANEVSLPVHGFKSIYGSPPDRIPCRHSPSAVFQSRLAWLPQVWGVRSSRFTRVNCVSKSAPLDGNMLISFDIISTLSIQPGVCIIRKASSKSGGPMQQARGSRRNRVALRSNSLVRRSRLFSTSVTHLDGLYFSLYYR